MPERHSIKHSKVQTKPNMPADQCRTADVPSAMLLRRLEVLESKIGDSTAEVIKSNEASSEITDTSIDQPIVTRVSVRPPADAVPREPSVQPGSPTHLVPPPISSLSPEFYGSILEAAPQYDFDIVSPRNFAPTRSPLTSVLSSDSPSGGSVYGTLMLGKGGRSKYLGPTAGSDWLKDVCLEMMRV